MKPNPTSHSRWAGAAALLALSALPVRILFWGLLPILLAVCPLSTATAQTGSASVPVNDVFVGSESEDYLRLLQSAGRVPVYPWSIRSFSLSEVDQLLPADSAHPWGQRITARPTRARSGFELVPIAPRMRVSYNSAFPYGHNDGPVWAGRGVTTAIQGGVSARYGPLSIVLAPIAFRAENAGFDLVENGRDGPLAFADARLADFIDLPQRFGDGAYQRFDLGESTARVDLAGLALGVSTAGQQWGPAVEHPTLLGNNAGGFFHAFLGTARPLNLGLGTIHGRVVWGELGQSEHSVVQGHGSRRFMSGLSAVATVTGVPGLELGAARFFHTPWPKGGLTTDQFTRLFDTFLKSRLPDRDTVGLDTKQDADNQLASVFFRWVLPRSGMELYGEYGRDDHNWNSRDLILQPDHMSAYVLGFGKVWERSPQHWTRFRGEIFNSQPSHLMFIRSEPFFGIHGSTRQGHTHRGQLLGSPAAVGGAASTLALDFYQPAGRWTVRWERMVRAANQAYLVERVVDPRGVDVFQTVGADAVLFRSAWDVSAGVAGVYDMNRDFGDDRLNWRLDFGLSRRIRAASPQRPAPPVAPPVPEETVASAAVMR